MTQKPLAGKVIPYQMTPPHGTAFQLLQHGAMQVMFDVTLGEDLAKCFEENARAIRDMTRIAKERMERDEQAKDLDKKVKAEVAAAPGPHALPSGRTMADVLKENAILRAALEQQHGKGAPDLPPVLIDESDAVSATVETTGVDLDPASQPHQSSGDTESPL